MYFKGHDAASKKISTENSTLDMDEITYLDGRYVSAPKATWRLSEFNMSNKSHTDIRLAVHLPHQQHVVFIGGQETEAVEKAAAKYTP
ncbi:hypothetical protein JTE90_008890 [Oedothorax gibbosus]|uniref:Uncharacterized protein n=1 Tax=Oedothorax gibbosus TaxID=931172 RepID=A0AAV6TU04_9ARAC|nr:hypothetical protein JTE90_008890 [Oedothorax gibbosus]